MENELKPCPFCGGAIRVNSIIDKELYIDVECECDNCNMTFSHSQSFVVSKNERVSPHDSFFEVWNRRCTNGT